MRFEAPYDNVPRDAERRSAGGSPPRPAGPIVGTLLACLWLLCSCHAPTAPSDGRTCEQRRDQLVDVLRKTPAESIATSIDVALPSASLPGTFGEGTLVELEEDDVRLAGVQIQGRDFDERVAALANQAASVASAGPLYVAAAADVTIDRIHALLAALPAGREVRLVFSTPPLAVDSGPDDPDAESLRVAANVLAERNASRRNALANEAYERYASCDSVRHAVASVRGLAAGERWPALRASMLDAIPKCACDDLNADGLRHLLVAEQRAGSVSLGSAPASYLSQARCAAALTHKTAQQLLDDIARFDAEFAGNWKEDALVFDEVATSERLLVYLCVALPDETLTWLLKRKGKVYFRAPGQSTCQGWQFDPMQPGSPIGTWRRDASAGPALAVHYRIGPGDVRLFGPARPGVPATTSTTSATQWPCDEDVPLTDVDETSIGVQSGPRWFFDEESCRKAPPSQHGFSGCIANLAAGIAPPPSTAPDETSSPHP